METICHKCTQIKNDCECKDKVRRLIGVKIEKILGIYDWYWYDEKYWKSIGYP